MKFGIHSLLFSETFTERDLPLLDKAKAMGFDAVDIVPFDIDNFPAKLVRQRAADLGLDIIIEIGMPAHANIISPDPANAPPARSLLNGLSILAWRPARGCSVASTTAVGAISLAACEPKRN